MSINEKLEKEEKKLANLKEKRKELDEKIKKIEEGIEKYRNIITQQKFSEVSQVLTSNGLTLEEIMQAVQSGNMISLQERLKENGKNKNTSEESME